jgi:hypothetical protein
MKYPKKYNTVVADGKPHKRFEGTIAAVTTVFPGSLLKQTAGTFDSHGTAAASLATSQSEIYIAEIAIDFPDRAPFSLLAYAASSVGVPILKCEVGREYHIKTAVNMTAYTVGELLVPGAAGDLARPTDTTPGALEYNAHGFILLEAISATEIVCKYVGLTAIDAT